MWVYNVKFRANFPPTRVNEVYSRAPQVAAEQTFEDANH